MSRRRINPDTGEPELTYREQMFINEYIQNGGNGKQVGLPSATSQPSPCSPQPWPLQKLRLIGRRIMNLQKINATQCLEGSSTQPPPLRQDRRARQTIPASTVESSNTRSDDARLRRVLRVAPS